VRPVKLTLEGIRSYRTKTEIDFSDLSLFALIGDTGSGKSSIIEGLCMALYSSTTWSGRNVTELMSDATDRMAVELIFTAEGDTWTVTRSHRRAGGAAGHKLVSASGEKVDGADAVNRRIQGLLGLNKDQFLRAVVMPQGQFEKLLRATPGDRTDILKGIFRLQALDQVRAQVGSIAGRWKEPIASLQGERRTLPQDPASAVAAATADHRGAAEKAAALERYAQAADTAEREATAASTAAEKVKSLRDRASEELHDLSVTEIDEIERRAVDLQRRTTEATGRRQTATEAADAGDTKAAEALGGFENRDAAVTGAGRLVQTATELAQLDDIRTKAGAAVAALDAAPPSTAVPPEVKDAETAARDALAVTEGQHRAAQAAHADAVRAYTSWRSAHEEHTKALVALQAAAAAAEVATDAEREAATAADAAELAVREARGTRDRAARSNAAAAAAAGCRPGDDCPVCDQTLPQEFSAPAAADLDEADRQVTAASAEADRLRQAHKAAAATVATRDAQQAAAATAVERANTALTAIAGELRTYLEGDISDNLTEQTALAPAALEVAERLAAVGRASDVLSAAATTANEARAAVAAGQSRWETRRSQHLDVLEAAEKAIAVARERVAQLPERWRPATEATSEEILRVADEVHAGLEGHAEHSEIASLRRGDAAAADTELLTLATEEATTVKQPLRALIAASARGHAALVTLAALVDAEGGVPGSPALDDPVDKIGASVVAVLAAGVALAKTASAEEERLRTEAGAQSAELQATLSAAAATSVGALRSMAGAAAANADHAKSRLEQVERDAQRAGQIDAALDVAVPFLAALDALRALLADGKFIGHLVREREVALLTEASRVLRSLSGDRFGFGDGFKVIDRRSGQERSPDTLSGGERFQASLALALALVEIATRSGGQLEAVFVDEGFGSLDAGSLDQALTTLGAVASDGKLVALVSHLRQVAEYVDQVLLVERDDSTGSRVRPLDQTERDTLLAEDARSRMTA